MSWFYILCQHNSKTCLEDDYIEDGYSNKEGRITFRVVGPDCVEIKCKTCGESVVIHEEDVR